MHKIIKAMTCFALGCSVLFSHNVFADDEINVPAFVQATYINKISETNNGIKIRWKKQNVSYYEVYRSTKKYKNYKLIKTVNGSTNNLTDNNVKANTAYYYKVKCYLESEDFPNNNTTEETTSVNHTTDDVTNSTSGTKNSENGSSIIGTSIIGTAINSTDTDDSDMPEYVESDFSPVVRFKVANKKINFNFNKQLKSLISKNIYKHYPCNVLVKKYVEAAPKQGKKITKELTNLSVFGSPTSNGWRHSEAKLSYNYKLKATAYRKTGKVKNTTFSLKSKLNQTAVSKKNSNMEKLKAGDIITYSRGGRATHVAIYIGKFDSKADLIKYLNDEVGIKCNQYTSWIKSWNGSCKHWVIQGGMGHNNQVYICNNANVTTTASSASRLSHKISIK